MRIFKIGLDPLSILTLEKVLDNEIQVELTNECRDKIIQNRSFLDDKLKRETQSYYGINTGFGYLCNVKINPANIQELQSNLVRSHACGVGDTISQDLSRMILFLKIINLSKAYSGVSIELVQRLIHMYNDGIIPVLYEYGSLGASGDLAPLAHLSLPLLGEGEIWEGKNKVNTQTILKEKGFSPLDLKAKEGLALLNGTQFSTAFASRNYLHGLRLFHLSNLIAAFSLEAYQADLSPFFGEIHKIRPHAGQIKAAKSILSYLDTTIPVAKLSIQDPYSFRCIPQVHGATFDTLDFVSKTLHIEINSVTDNPNIFSAKDSILSGGNFHAQPIAFASDYLSIALAEIGSISERRSFNLLNGNRGLPEFLSPAPGLNSGMMIAQYTAASLVSKNKQLASPSSIDSISSSKGQEDHVSMAANAGTKCFRLVDNVYRILAIEFMLANQALEFNSPKRFSSEMTNIRDRYREKVLPLETDRVLYKDIEQTINFLHSLGEEITHS